jgi:hypothetical protein
MLFLSTEMGVRVGSGKGRSKSRSEAPLRPAACRAKEICRQEWPTIFMHRYTVLWQRMINTIM